MKKLIIFALLAVSANTQANTDNWSFVTSSPKFGKVYIDKKSMKVIKEIQGSYIFQANFRKVVTDPKSELLAVVERYEINCHYRSAKALAGWAFFKDGSSTNMSSVLSKVSEKVPKSSWMYGVLDSMCDV